MRAFGLPSLVHGPPPNFALCAAGYYHSGMKQQAPPQEKWPAALAESGLVLLWLVVGMVLRVWQMGWFPLREDEALYSFWARLVASGQDVMLERVAVDKPPVFIYTLARWFQWFGPSDAAGRSLNLLLSGLTMLALWLLARHLFGRQLALWTLAFFALSPFAISFAPTVYTDPMLTLWLVLALLAASWRLGLLAGLFLGLAFATKQSGLLFIPLIVLALTLGLEPGGVRQPKAPWARVLHRARPFIAAGLSFYYVWFKVWQWDGWRILPAEIPDFWTQSWHSYGGLALIPPAQWPIRLHEWWQVWRWWGGSAPGTLLLAGLAAVAVLASVRQARHQTSARWVLLLAAFVSGYLALHFFVSFQAWDRYLLPLAPLSALLAAYGGSVVWAWLMGRAQIWRMGAALLLISGLMLGAGRAAAAKMPVGGDHGAYAGLLDVAEYLQAHTPDERGVVYQRWLGWQWQWYLWQGPPLVYWADADMLLDDIDGRKWGYTRFVVFPAWRLPERARLARALARAELRLQPRLRVRAGDELRFLVDEIVPLRPLPQSGENEVE